MADNVLGTKITELEEAQAAGLTDNALLIVEPETPPTKRSKLSTFFTWVKGKLAAWILSSYDEVMAATEAGYLVDALAVKDGFTQLNTKYVAEHVGISIGSLAPGGTTGTKSIEKDGYSAFAVVGFKTGNNTIGVCDMILKSATELDYRVRNMGTATATNVFVTVSILYKKN